jgi:Spy/CpxP family protein refolding chaperone
METNRFMQIMVMELTSDILKAEEALEKTINSSDSLDVKLINTKNQLSNLLFAENKLAKFNSMFRNEDTIQ